LNVNPLKSLTTEGRFTINGTFILNSDATGNSSLINNDVISYGGACNVVAELYLTGWQYHHVSSPMTSTNSDRFKVDPVAPYHNPNFYWYDETDLNADWTATAWHEFTGIMAVMDGYTTYFDRNPTILFNRSQSGDFNTGNKSKALTYTGGSLAPVIHRGWNFVGNPYPAHIDWDDAAWTKINIHNSIYFWNGTNYSYYVASGTAQDDGAGVNNGTSIIPPMQGYFVKVEGNDAGNYTGTLGTPESARTTATHAFYKKNQIKNEIDVIRISVTGNNKSDETAVRFIQDATSGFDSQYDAFKLFPGDWYGVPMIYSVLPEDMIAAINTLPGYYNELKIPLGFQTPQSGTFTINIPAFNLNETTEIYFEDLHDGKIINIENGLLYSFISDAGQFDNRFRIVFSVQSSEIDNQLNDLVNVNIYSSGNDICLESQQYDAIVGNVQIIDMYGNIIYHSNNTAEGHARLKINKPAGNYIVKLTNKYGVFIEKVFLMKY